jgi:hypothetical protein
MPENELSNSAMVSSLLKFGRDMLSFTVPRHLFSICKKAFSFATHTSIVFVLFVPVHVAQYFQPFPFPQSYQILSFLECLDSPLVYCWVWGNFK